MVHCDKEFVVLRVKHRGNFSVAPGVCFPALTQFRRAFSQDVRCQHIKQCGFVDRLHGVLRKEVIAPVQQIVDILHDDCFLIRTET